MSSLTWLHLSDLHFNSNSQKKWDQSIVLRALMDDVRERFESDGLRPDLILVSGDIAFNSFPQEYELASNFFDELLNLTSLTKERLLIVPGNHDVDRSAISFGSRTLAGSLDNREKLATAMESNDDRRTLLKKLDTYGRFIRDYLQGSVPFDDQDYFYVRRILLEGGEVAILGLNSAWLSTGDKDLGRLALGEYQVRQALNKAKGENLKIVLMHHSFDWLWPYDRNDCEDLLLEGCDFILHGHLHETSLKSLSTPDAGAMIISAGAGYESRSGLNSFNWVKLEPESRQGTVYFRMYTDKRGGFWTKDVTTYKNVPNGEFEFSLPSRKKTARKKEAHRPTLVAASKLEAGYLRRIQTTCNALPLAIIDPKAAERTLQQTMDLIPLYVALNTKTPVSVEEKRGQKPRRPRAEGPLEPDRETRLLSVLEAAARDRIMVLLGDPGSGKSTFLSYLALCLAGARLEQLGEPGIISGEMWLEHLKPIWTHGPLLPLQITLRLFAKSEFCDGTAARLLDYLDDTLSAQGLCDFIPLYRRQLAEGGAILLLDGLDEVADPAQRQTVRNAVADFYSTHNHPQNRFIVTCRGYAYQEPCFQLNDFVVHTLMPLNQGQIDTFITCWYKEICRRGWKTESEAKELTERLQAAMRRPDLAPLARIPLQMAMMASLQFSWGRLPEDRVELYHEMVQLLLVRWQEARLGQDAGVTQTIKPSDLESALERTAFVAHGSQVAVEGTADISQAALLDILKDTLGGSWSWERAGKIMDYIQDRVGLLIDHGKGTFTFPHRSYQEYLAGSFLSVQPDFPDQAAKLARENYAQWREVMLWAVAIMARLKKMSHISVAVVAALCPSEVESQVASDADWRSAYLAGEAFIEIGEREVKSRKQHIPVFYRVRLWLSALIERGALTPRERAEAGRVLAKLEDPREYVMVPEKMEFCPIPAGSFLMGTNKKDLAGIAKRSSTDLQWFKSEMPQISSELPEYSIGRYPVTNAQFQAFVNEGGYQERRYWTEAEKAGYWKEGEVKRRYFRSAEGEKFQEVFENAPADFGEPYNLPNHPAVGVNWYEAMAYTIWLSERLGKEVRLPSEAEWEKAARETDGRIFPWGNEIDPDKANYSDTGISTTSAVGCFPRGESPFHVMDMAGNVWEWCATKWQDSYKNYKNDNSPEGYFPRVLRGGAFFDLAWYVRCAVRFGFDPVGRSWSVGFRVVVAPTFFLRIRNCRTG